MSNPKNQNLLPNYMSHQSSSHNSIHSSNQIQNNSVNSDHDPYLNNKSPTGNTMMNNFQNIESRYMNQQEGNINLMANQSSQRNSQCNSSDNNQGNKNTLYLSQQNNIKGVHERNSSHVHSLAFNDDDISSISRTSKADLSQYSDWSELNQNQELKNQGYNSADNSIVKHMHKK